MTTTYLTNPQFIAYGDLLFKRRNAIFPIFMIALLLAFEPNPNPQLPWIGLAITIAGQLLRMAVIGFAYIKRGGLNKKVYADTLVTTGFFSMCRNPLYVGNVMILGGLLIMHGNPAVLLIGSAFFLSAYWAIIATEENFLRNKFGEEYSYYCSKVPRWWIRFERLPSVLSGMKFNWRKVIYKDYSTMFSWGLQAIAMLAYREYMQTHHASMQWLIYAVVLGVFTLFIRLVKKRYPL